MFNLSFTLFHFISSLPNSFLFLYKMFRFKRIQIKSCVMSRSVHWKREAFEDIVLPLPGFDVVYPVHLRDAYEASQRSRPCAASGAGKEFAGPVFGRLLRVEHGEVSVKRLLNIFKRLLRDLKTMFKDV